MTQVDTFGGVVGWEHWLSLYSQSRVSVVQGMVQHHTRLHVIGGPEYVPLVRPRAVLRFVKLRVIGNDPHGFGSAIATSRRRHYKSVEPSALAIDRHLLHWMLRTLCRR